MVPEIIVSFVTTAEEIVAVSGVGGIAEVVEVTFSYQK